MIEIIQSTLLCFSPILECRVAIPFGYVKGMSPLLINTIALISSFILTVVLLWIIPIIVGILESHFKFLHSWLTKILRFTQKKHSRALGRFGNVILIVLVAVPFPGSGIYTAALVAYLFKIQFKKALILIFIGAVLSIIIMNIIIGVAANFWYGLQGFLGASL